MGVSDVFRQGSTEKKRKVRTIPTTIIIHLDSLCKLVHAMMLRATSNKFCWSSDVTLRLGRRPMLYVWTYILFRFLQFFFSSSLKRALSLIQHQISHYHSLFNIRLFTYITL